MYQRPLRSDEIYHYGIKRRSGRYPYGSGNRPYQRMSFDEKRQQSKRNVRKNVPIRSSEEYQGEKFYKDLSKERLIKRGSVCYRFTSNENERNEGSTFVVFDAKGIQREGEWFSESLGYKCIVTKYKTKKDLKIPSASKMTTTLIEEMMKNQDSLNKYVKEYEERSWVTPEKIKNQIITDPNKTLVDVYRSVFRSSSKNIGELGDKIHEKLKKEGYDAVPDLHDLRNDTESPLFIFDRSSSITKDKQWRYWGNEDDDVSFDNPDWSIKYDVEYLE